MNDERDRILELLKGGRLEEAGKLLWPAAATQAWFDMMAPVLEAEGSGYARANPRLAVWCYEQAKALYQADSSGATSGGEGMAMMAENRGSHLGRKIWLLKSQSIE